ncbi:helix-turn-helix transcriptional regulator [Falsiroseomonas sp. HW251]|uniref:helix-turn-helix transcriptional regulator n=1 Tax=Falsiroseomonas sp. HW251 TaxID=3390998 RepID=UPI003D31DA2C
MTDPAPLSAGIAAQYRAPALRDYVRHQALLGRAGHLMEIAQPPGEYGSAPADELLLVQPQVAGIGLRKVWGAGRFDGVAPVRSLWLVPPRTATALTVRTRHVIRTLSIGAASLGDSLPDRARPGDLGALAAAPFFSPLADHLVQALWHAAAAGEDSRLRVDGALHLLLDELARLAGEKPPPRRGGLAPWQVRVATEAIAEQPAATLSLAALAALVRLSPQHFARAFAASLGVPPHRYQKQLRIRRAAALLEQGRLSVTEVAMAVGYDSGQALARAFRQETGVAPRDWRRARMA